MSAAFDRVVSALETAGRRVRANPRGVIAQCPAHEDRNPSLSVARGDGCVLLYCHAGCHIEDVCQALGLTKADLFDDPTGKTYRYDDGRTVRRTPEKRFSQSGNTKGTPTLYRAGEAAQAVAEGRSVWLVEGEKDADTLRTLAGVTSTTAPMGATNFARVDVQPLTGANVVAIVDRDEAGDGWAQSVQAVVGPVAASLRFVRAKAGKDTSDHMTAGHGLDEFEPYEVPETDDAAVIMDETAAEAGIVAHLAAEEYRKLKAREAARARLAAEKAEDAEPFDLDTLGAVLARPEPPAGRVPGLIPWEASTLVVAQRKTGKTTLLVNLVRALVTGERFLGQFPVTPLTESGTVALLNYEVSAATVARWADEAGVPHDRLILVNLRGRRNPLSNEQDRKTLADQLKARRVESILVDPFSRAFTGDSQNDAGQVGAWLADLDRFARGHAGARDIVLAAHAGWNGDRTRGTSALEDWADVIITLTRDDTDARYLRAIGRDIDVEEDRLEFDPDTRTLTLTGAGNRKATAASRHIDGLRTAVVELVTERPGLNTTELSEQLREAGHSFQRGDVGKAAQAAVADGRLTSQKGKRNAVLYYPSNPAIPNYPELSQGTTSSYPDPSYREGIAEGLLEGSSYPEPGTDKSGDVPPPYTDGPPCPACGRPNQQARHILGYVCLRCHAAGVQSDASTDSETGRAWA